MSQVIEISMARRRVGASDPPRRTATTVPEELEIAICFAPSGRIETFVTVSDALDAARCALDAGSGCAITWRKRTTNDP